MQKYSATIETIIAFLILLVTALFFARAEYYKRAEEKHKQGITQEKE